MVWTNIIAIVAAIGITWFTFKQKRPAAVQIAVIIGLLGGGYYFFFMEDDKDPKRFGKEYGCGPFGGGTMLSGGKGGGY